MRRLVFIVGLVCLAGPSCDSDRRADEQPAADAGQKVDATAAKPSGVPKSVDNFGAAVTDVDRIVLTERMPLPSEDSTARTRGSGDEAHPSVWETSDPEWIESFITAVGRQTKPVERPRPDCRPWADLTLYRDQTAVSSFAVECPRETFTTFRSRPATHVFVASDRSAMETLLQNLRRSDPLER